MNPPTYFFPSLTRLRSVAVILVLLAHSNLYGLLFSSHAVFRGTGKSAVWLFFCLSSVLLYSRLKSQFESIHAAHHLSFTSWLADIRDVSLFYLRKRLLRVFPLLWFYSFSLFALSALFPFAALFIPIDSWIRLFLQLFLIDNPIGITWSLIIEFKFYLFLIPITFLLSFFARRYLRIAIIIFFTSFSLFGSYPFVISDNISLLPVFYIFCFGILTSEYIDTLPILFKNNRNNHFSINSTQFKYLILSVMILMFFIAFVPLQFILFMKYLLALVGVVSVTALDNNFFLALFQPIQALFWCLVISFAVRQDYLIQLNTFDSPVNVNSSSKILSFAVRGSFYSLTLNVLDRFVFFPLASISYAVYLLHPPIYFLFSKFIIVNAIDSNPIIILLFFLSQVIVLSFSWVITNFFDKHFT